MGLLGDVYNATIQACNQGSAAPEGTSGTKYLSSGALEESAAHDDDGDDDHGNQLGDATSSSAQHGYTLNHGAIEYADDVDTGDAAAEATAPLVQHAGGDYVSDSDVSEGFARFKPTKRRPHLKHTSSKSAAVAATRGSSGSSGASSKKRSSAGSSAGSASAEGATDADKVGVDYHPAAIDSESGNFDAEGRFFSDDSFMGPGPGPSASPSLAEAGGAPPSKKVKAVAGSMSAADVAAATARRSSISSSVSSSSASASSAVQELMHSSARLRAKAHR